MKPKLSLAETHPDLVKQWHPTKNEDLVPKDFTPGSGKKVWWKCDKGSDHKWSAEIKSRARKGRGCPVCSGHKVVESNCLATLNPELAKEWHPTLNGNLTSNDFPLGSHKKIWWKCSKEDDHVWETKIMSRAYNNTGCPYCSGKRISDSNRLSTLIPISLEIWHPNKNGKLLPSEVSYGSVKKVWWICEKGHGYKQSINSKFKGGNLRLGCPVCNNSTSSFEKSLKFLKPELSKLWHPKKNGDKNPENFNFKSSVRVWWKCPKGDDHIWEGRISTMSASKGCPFCVGSRIAASNSIVNTNPKIYKEWYHKKNINIDPYKTGRTSQKKVWWKCLKGDDHIWNASINNRTNRQNSRGCPVCSGHKVVESNCLATLNPELAKEWHPTLNGELIPSNFTLGSGKKVWWKCSNGDDHVWKTKISHRTGGSGCPYCTLTPQSKQELTITFELMKLFKNINPKGLKTKLEGQLRAIDIFIPKLNLCIEFDGSYWHKDKQDIDKIKSEMLFEEGFKLIRLREEPLKKIYDTDVISKQPYNGKQVTNNILSMILTIFEIDAKLVSNIKAYQSKDGLQNEKGLEKYIDKILTEKSNK